MFLRSITRRCAVATRCIRSSRLLSHKPVTANALKRESDENKELILSILNLTTTRRETRFYLNKYSTFNCRTGPNEVDTIKRVSVIKLRGNLFEYDRKQLSNFTNTLNYMKKLGCYPMVLIDCDYLSRELDFNKVDNYMFTQFNYLNSCFKPLKLTPLRCLMTIGPDDKIKLESSKPIHECVENDTIPVMFPYGYESGRAQQWIIGSQDFLSNLVPQLHKPNEITVEKLIFIDKLGGIPSIERSNNSHVFINLEQEFDRIQSELQIGHLSLYERGIHRSNIVSMHEIMSSIPYKDLTGIITTLEVANETVEMNPVIYNILTDRSIVSSSLPTTKYQNKQSLSSKVARTSIIKKGLNVEQHKSFDSIDMVKFKALIDDSFKRSLDLDHYLARIVPILNQIIIVGDYDGIAIITDEMAPSGKTIPYLDKFAISRHAQGSLGGADMIFNILLHDYKDKLLWRSKKINPVNGWYFQRSKGSFDLKNSEFRVFWTNPKTTLDDIRDYIDIGMRIQPSWEK